MRRIRRSTYRWLRCLGTCVGTVGGVVALMLVTAAEDAAFARAGERRVDFSPYALPTFLVLGALAGWILVVLVVHIADAVPAEFEQPQE
jgi:hypothetical protein